MSLLLILLVFVVKQSTAAPAADNCAGSSIAQTAGPTSGATFPIGTTTITYRATDAALNTLILSL
jgi:hypothetical protein